MQLFFFLLFINLLLGAVPDFLPKGIKNSYGLFSFARGVISASSAILLFNTQFAYLFAFTGCAAGLIFAPWHKKDRENSLVGTSWGFLAAAIPTTAAAMALFFIAGYGISNNKIVSLTWTFFLLPFLTALVARHDIYIILSVLMSLVVIYHILPSLEEATQRQPNSLLKKRVVFIKGLSLLVLLSFMTILFLTRHVYRGFGLQMDIIRQGNPDFPLIALTFDDGPDPLYTPAILDILREYEVPATFFLVGKHVEAYPDLARRIVAEGHEIGNHTYSHRSIIPASKLAIEYEIMAAHRAITRITGKEPLYFRPPRGVYNQYARDLLLQEKYTMVLWNITSKDWAEISYHQIKKNVSNNTTGGSIILLHDSGNFISSDGGDRHNTVKALPLIIEELKKKYTFVTVGEMILTAGLTHVIDEE